MLQNSKIYTALYSLILLNKQQQALALIFISKVPSVSYCSTVLLYAVFNFVCLVYFNKWASQYFWERNLNCGQSR
jgi:hypothetical protein